MEEMKSAMGTEEVAAMDEYMKKSDYAADGSMVKLASVANLAEDATNAFKLGGKSALDFAQKTDLENVQKTVINAQISALQAQETANKALDKADGALGIGSEARIVAGDAYTKADQAKTTAEAAQVGLAGKVNTIDGKGLSANDYTNEEKSKLTEIEAGANHYVHPATHPVSIIEGLPEVKQTMGASATDVMSQKAVTDELQKAVKSVNGQMPDANGDVKITEVENAQKLGGQLPTYYATKEEVNDKIPIAKLNETASGSITVDVGTASIRMWQRRNGWTRLAVMVNGFDEAHGSVFMQIVGGGGLVTATKFVGTCKIKSTGATTQCIFEVSEAGQIRARNNVGANMSEVAFDVTLPSLYV